MEEIIKEIIQKSKHEKNDTKFISWINGDSIKWEFSIMGETQGGSFLINSEELPDIKLNYPDADLRGSVLRLAQKSREIVKNKIKIRSTQEILGSKILFNEQDVRKFYQFFKHNNPTEIRVFDEIKYPKGKSILVKTEDEFVEKCRYYSEEDKVSVYIGARDRNGKGDKNVISSHFILFEIDEHDIKKPEEKEKVLKFLEDNNIKVGMMGMSGA